MDRTLIFFPECIAGTDLLSVKSLIRRQIKGLLQGSQQFLFAAAGVQILICPVYAAQLRIRYKDRHMQISEEP